MGRGRKRTIATVLLVLGGALSGCVTVAEFRKLEYEVNRMKAAQEGGGGSLADLHSDLQQLRLDLSRLEGRVEEAEHRSKEALEEARKARAAAAPAPTCPDREATRPAEVEPGAKAAPEVPPEAPPPAGISRELRAYRAAYDAWRSGETDACIDRFGKFLQAFPASDYAADAAFWLADCYFQRGDFKTAILRFDDVASRYPASDKAAEALYRQGEALLRLGPGYGRAAEKAFERVVEEYPDSRRAQQASQQLQALRAGDRTG